MALVNMKCSSCGAILTVRDGCFVCEYCGSVFFRMTDDTSSFRADTVSLQEFRSELEKNEKSYTVNCPLGVFSDTDGALYKSKLKAADDALQKLEPYRVADILKGAPVTAATMRLRLLARVGARSESELAFYAGDLSAFEEYGALLALCDDATKDVYATIAKRCQRNAENAKKIAKGHEFLRIGQYSDGLAYAKTIVAEMPFNASAWELLIRAKCLDNKNYSPFEDLKKLETCPDFVLMAGKGEKDVNGALYDVAPEIRERCRTVAGKTRAKCDFFFKYLLKPILVLVAVGVLIGIWKLIEAIAG